MFRKSMLEQIEIDQAKHQSPQTQHSHPVPFFLITRWQQPLFWRSALCGLIFVLLLGVAACAPAQPDTSQAALTAQTEQIALTYAADGDLEQARAALAEVEVANPNQWLVLVAEEAVSTQPGTETTDALAMLLRDLGLNSAVVARYLDDQETVAVAPAPTEETLPTATIVIEPSPTAQPTAVPTDTPVTEPTATAADPTPVATNTPEPTLATAQVQAIAPMNVRAGPSTSHPIINALQTGSTAAILAKNSTGDWWQIDLGNNTSGWIYAPLVETTGNVTAVAVAAAIPTLPPPTATPVPQPTSEPVAQPPAEPAEPEPQAPAAPAATDTPAPAAAGPDFRLVEQRLWGVEENGGFLAGGVSVNCGEKQVLQVIVEDANGNRINGVTIKGVYRNEIHVTGEKGEGVAELDVNKDGDDIMVIRDVDGREVTSDRAVGNTARTWDIPFSQLIQARYCTDDASCQKFVNEHGCYGHFSWTVRFRRNY